MGFFMTDTNSKLERFIQHILTDAASERDEILAGLDARRSDELAAAEDAILAETYEYIRKSVTEIRTETGRQVSQRLLSNKRDIAVRREQIADEVFNQTRERISEFVASPEYEEHLMRLFEKALEALGNPYDGVVYLRPEDMRFEQELRKLRPTVFFEFCEGNFSLGGIILDCRSKQQRIDESFDTALSDLDGHFAELFGLSLSE